jgi:hypothetical protein
VEGIREIEKIEISKTKELDNLFPMVWHRIIREKYTNHNEN